MTVLIVADGEENLESVLNKGGKNSSECKAIWFSIFFQ